MAVDDIACAGGAPFVHSWFNRIARERVPFQGSINLTHRCNLSCVHCYVSGADPGSSSAPRNDERADTELTTDQWIAILDQIADAGCLFLLITGGEPLLRKDFAILYRHAKLKGMLPGVFTNATLVTSELCGLFAELPPRYVEVSLYGATRETYERVTGVSGSFDRCMRGIRMLHEGGCQLALKTILMTVNRHEYEAMSEFARELGVQFRMDAGLFPRLNGDCGPLGLRVDAREAVEHELANVKTLESYCAFYDRIKGSAPSDRLYQCGAGQRTFHVDARGYLQPCLLSDDVRYDIKKGSFADGWRNAIPAVREIPAPLGGACHRCEMRFVCGICPPVAKREAGSPAEPCAYWCSIGDERMRMLKQHRETGSREQERQEV